MECAAVAHAASTLTSGPWNPYFIEMLEPGPIFIETGIVNGLVRNPLLKLVMKNSAVVYPPMELPTMTPKFWRFIDSLSNFACDIASSAATKPNCDERLMRRDSLLSKYLASS